MKLTDLQQTSFWGIVPAAGLGLRMAADCPKQYIKIHDRTILEYAIESLVSHPHIEKVVVALHEHDDYWKSIVPPHKEKIITTVGGEHRINSVWSALQALDSYAHDNDWVLVHDAVRPCLSHELIDRLIHKLHDHPIGGLLGIPVRDTLKKVDADHVIENTLSREHVWAAQTPQMFRYRALREAIKQTMHQDRVITDEASAFEAIGEYPQMVLGDVSNIKVTYPADLKIADFLLKEKG